MVKVLIKNHVTNTYVCIDMKHVGAQVCISQLSDFSTLSTSLPKSTDTPSLNSLNVVVKFVQKLTQAEQNLIMGSISHHSLCRSGCPKREMIDINSILSHAGYNEYVYGSLNVTEDIEECSGLYGYYFLTCLFNVKIKGSNEQEISLLQFLQNEMDDVSLLKRSHASEWLQPQSSSYHLSPYLLSYFCIYLFSRLLIGLMVDTNSCIM